MWSNLKLSNYHIKVTWSSRLKIDYFLIKYWFYKNLLFIFKHLLENWSELAEIIIENIELIMIKNSYYYDFWDYEVEFQL